MTVFRRLMIGSVLLVGCALAVSTILAIGGQAQVLHDELISKGTLVARQIGLSTQQAFRSLNWLSVESAIQSMISAEDILSCRIVRPNGTVYLADNRDDYGETIEAGLLQGEPTIVTDYADPRTGHPGLLISEPVMIGEETWHVLVAISSERVEAANRISVRNNLLLAAAILIPATLAALVLARGIARPIADLTGAAKDFAAGDLDRSVRTRATGEIGTLAQAFDNMSTRLRETIRTLEERVAVEQEHRRQMDTLLQVGTRLVSLHTRQDVLDVICREAVSLLGGTSAYVAQYDQENRQSTVVAEWFSSGASSHEQTPVVGLTFVEEDSMTEQILRGQPHRTSLSDPTITAVEREDLENYGGHTALFLPLIARGRALGYVEVWESRYDRLYSEDELLVGQTLGNLAAIAIDNALLLQAVQETIHELSTSTHSILSATTQQAAGAREQSAAISQASTTIDEVRSITEQTTEHAQGVADLAQHTEGISRAGEQAVMDTISGMEAVKQKVESIASNILALSEQAQSVGQIIATVNEIAAQSNMLALNAAVEAARAGEAGKGFAVVAGEVRTLAEQSRTATVQVKELLGEIQRGVNAAVMATEEGMKGVDAGMKLAGEAGLSIQKLAEGVTESTHASSQIAAAAGQQQTGMEQIAAAVENIRQVAVQTVSSAQQSEQAAKEMSSLANRLRGLVERHRL